MSLMDAYALLSVAAAVMALVMKVRLRRRRAVKTVQMFRCLSQALQREIPIDDEDESDIAVA